MATYTPEQVQAAQGLFASPQVVPYAPPPGPFAAPVEEIPLAGGYTPAQVGAAQALFAPAGPAGPAGAQVAVEPEAPAPAGAFGPPAPEATVPPPVSRQPSSFVRTTPRASNAGGGGAVGPSKLQKQADADREAFMSGFDRQAEAKRAEADAEATKASQIGAFHDIEAARQESEASIQREEYRATEANHAAFLAKSAAMLDDLASQKIDPNRVFANADTSERMSFALGGILGGVMQGMGYSSGNDFLANVNRVIDRDIDAQKSNIENKRTAIAARNTLYGQMREQFGDVRLADAQYRAAALTAAETRLKGMMSTLENPVIQARGQQAIEALQQQKAEHQMAFSQQALQRAQAAAAAAANAQRAAQDKMFERAIKLRELDIKEIEAGGKANAGTVAYANSLEQAGLPQALADIEHLKGLLPHTDDGKLNAGADIPGTGLWADAKVKVAGQRFGLNDEERLNRNNIRQLALAYRKAITGSGGSAQEMQDIEQSFLGSRTTKELWDAIAKSDAMIAARVRNLEAGAGPETVARYKANAAQSTRPPVTSFVRGLR